MPNPNILKLFFFVLLLQVLGGLIAMLIYLAVVLTLADFRYCVYFEADRKIIFFSTFPPLRGVTSVC